MIMIIWVGDERMLESILNNFIWMSIFVVVKFKWIYNNNNNKNNIQIQNLYWKFALISSIVIYYCRHQYNNINIIISIHQVLDI